MFLSTMVANPTNGTKGTSSLPVHPSEKQLWTMQPAMSWDLRGMA